MSQVASCESPVCDKFSVVWGGCVALGEVVGNRAENPAGRTVSKKALCVVARRAELLTLILGERRRKRPTALIDDFSKL
jgi:hypothetical protein